MTILSPRTWVKLAFALLLLIGTFPATVQAQAIAGTINLGSDSGPVGLAYDSGTHEVFVVDSSTDSVAVISDSTDRVIANITLASGCCPGSLAYDSATDEVFVPVLNGIDVISDKTNTIVDMVPLNGSFPDSIVYDSGKGELFLAIPGGTLQVNHGPVMVKSNSSIAVVSDTSDKVVESISLGGLPANLTYGSGIGQGPEPFDLAYDSSRGEVFAADFVQNYTNGHGVPSIVSVISDSTNALVTNVAVGGGPNPEGLAYDSTTGEMFVADGNGTALHLISDTANKVVGTILLEPRPAGNATKSAVMGVAYDPSAAEVFVADGWDYIPNTVSVVSDATDKVVGTIDVGYAPSGLVYDSGTNEIFVSNYGSGTISVISTTIQAPEFAQQEVALIAFMVIGTGVLAHTRFRFHSR